MNKIQSYSQTHMHNAVKKVFAPLMIQQGVANSYFNLWVWVEAAACFFFMALIVSGCWKLMTVTGKVIDC